MHLTAVHARISEDTPRDLRGVEELRHRLARAYAIEPYTITGRSGPFERTHWRDDLNASHDVLEAAAERIAPGSITLASDCSLALATLPTANANVLWLDAHADYDTPATQTYDFLGCMSLAGSPSRRAAVMAASPQRWPSSTRPAISQNIPVARNSASTASPSSHATAHSKASRRFSRSVMHMTTQALPLFVPPSEVPRRVDPATAR